MNHLAAIVLIALTLLGEARGQPPDGQACLAHTVMNRMALSGWSAEQVMFQRWQYMVWEKDVLAPGFGFRDKWLRCMAYGEFPLNPWCMEPVLMIGSEADWWRTFGMAARVYFGEAPPPGCEGVVSYDNLGAFWDGEDPPWAVAKIRTVTIGDHTFYRNPGELPMPTYEYECTNCEHRFDLRRPIRERNNAPLCPECLTVESGARIVTVPAVIRVEGGATHTGHDIYPDVPTTPSWEE